MSTTNHAVIFISCGIFKEELEYLMREKGFDWKIVFLDAALHVNFDRLKAKLTKALEEHHKAGREIQGHLRPLPPRYPGDPRTLRRVKDLGRQLS